MQRLMRAASVTLGGIAQPAFYTMLNAGQKSAVVTIPQSRAAFTVRNNSQIWLRAGHRASTRASAARETISLDYWR